ncbi:MAG: DUF4115 domain-containing protein [Amphritea sp.]|nr:DUF4115 domain-containing protein [Amphritea sp.]
MSNEKSQSVDQEEQGLAFPVGELIAAREAAGLSQKDVARDLRLSEKYIEAIETADFAALPSMVFARGYVRSYTKLLQLDMDRYLSIFDEVYGQGRPSREYAGVSGIEPQARLGDPMVKWTTRIFILVVIAASIWWWKTQQGNDQLAPELVSSPAVEVQAVDGSTVVVEPEVVVDSNPVIVPVSVVDSAVADTQPAESVVETASAEASVTETTEQESSAEPEVTLAAVVEETVQPEAEVAVATVVETAVVTEVTEESSSAADVGRLQVSFTEECWVSVLDRNGEVLAKRVKPAGSKLDVSGPLPMKVLLGNASAVQEVLFNGAPVSIENVSRANVVRMSLPMAQ